MKNFLIKLKENKHLFFLLVSMIALSLAFFSASFIDSRTVHGINTWIKPLKFALSFIPYCLTFIYILQNHPEQERNTYSKKFAITLWLEIIIIAFQAARAVPSHFNQNSPFDGILFAIMGLAITYNTLITAKLTYSFFKAPSSKFNLIELKAIKLGLVLFLLACLEGGYMSSQISHSVGGQNNDPALPFLNWSTIAGDLRVTHFIGLHGIQILLLIAIVFNLVKKVDSSHKLEKLFSTTILIVFNLIIALMTYSFILTLKGISLFA